MAPFLRTTTADRKNALRKAGISVEIDKARLETFSDRLSTDSAHFNAGIKLAQSGARIGLAIPLNGKTFIGIVKDEISVWIGGDSPL